MAIDLKPGSNALEYTHFTTGSNALLISRLSTNFTFFARVKLNVAAAATGPSAAIIKIDRIPPTALAGAFFWYMLGVSSSGYAFAQVKNFGPAVTSVSLTPLVPGNWHNVAGVFRPSAFRQVWLDGVSGPAETTAAAPTGLNGALIGGSHANYSGAFNRPLTACLQDIVFWGRELTGAELLALNTLEDVTSLHQTDIFFHVPFVDEDSATVAWDYTSGVPVAVSLLQDGDSGSVTTCNDSPEFPIPPPDPDDLTCDDIEDEADEAQAVDVDWDPCVLVPQDISVDMEVQTASPGRSLGGRKQFVQYDAGAWRITLSGIKVWSTDELLTWREYQDALNGRNGVALVPVYEGKLSDTPIAATMAGEFVIGEVRLTITQTAGAAIRAGMHFSTDGGRLYRIKRLLSPSVDGNVQVIVWPPLRELIEFGEALNFNDPSCRCRLERDDGMDIMLEHLKFGTQSVTFREDV